MANWQDIRDMKNRLYIFAFIVGLLSFCFISCEHTPDSILKGTWKCEPFNVSSSAEEIYDLIYVFDGKGNYTHTTNSSDGIRTSKGTYTIENGTLVRTFYTKYTLEGDPVGEGSGTLTLDTKSTPPTLTTYAYTSDGIILGELRYVKQ